MQIITVAPIARGALQGALTYFSKEPIAVGMVVVAPVRTREVPAIVLESRDVSDAKSALRSSDYAIRKITRAKPRRIWLPAFLKAVEETANFSAQKLGETLLALTPKTILDAHLEGSLPEPKEQKFSDGENKHQILAIQSDTKTRLESYQRLIRESFVRYESVFICVPTEDDVLRVADELGRGIEDYTFAFHSSITKKSILQNWERVSTEKHAVLVVGTAQYLAIPRYFKTIVIDEEHSRAWKMIARPLLDLRVFLEQYARAGGCSLIIGASILRAETHERLKRGVIGEFGRIAIHARCETITLLIDPRREEKTIRENTGGREMILISKELQELLQNSIKNNERVLLLSARKGLAPITACGDCGTLVRCPECDTPLVIHRIRDDAPLRAPRPLSPEHQAKNSSDGGRVAASNATSKKESTETESQIFICHGCGFMRMPESNVHEVCPNCKGWRLQGLGIGIDLIEKEVSSLFPDTPIYVLDGDHAKTRAQAKKIIERFKKSEGGILIATPMAIPLLATVDNTAIISIDSLFAIPDIRMSERIFALVLALREKTTGTLLIQTRADDTSIFEQALAGDLLQFTENELSIRKAFSYPPYGTIIKITLRGKRAEIATEMERLRTFLADYAPIVPGTMAREPKNIFRMHMILKLAENNWPNSDLLAKLRALPPHFTIEVNPDHLL